MAGSSKSRARTAFNMKFEVSPPEELAAAKSAGWHAGLSMSRGVEGSRDLRLQLRKVLMLQAAVDSHGILRGEGPVAFWAVHWWQG